MKQLMHEKNALIEIFEKALHVMENCSCKDDPQKDGCYHCLYAYRQSQQIGNISRTTAIRILKSILSGKDNVQKIDKINDIPINPLFDSELEQRFMEAIRTKVGAGNVSDTIRNGKHSYYVKIENYAWEIEPQVLLDASSDVSVTCKPDFVFWPVSAPGHKPVAVFTDGFLYHKDIVSDDTIKREAIRRSGNFRVWSLSFKDVQSVLFAPQGDFYTATLEAEKMPSGKMMYQNMIKKQKADAIEPAKLSSFDLLLEYLKLPEAESVFKGQACAYSLSLLEPAQMNNNLAFNNWETSVKAVNDQTHFTNVDFTFPGTIFGSWIPRSSNANLTIHSGILAAELKKEGTVAVCAVLNDEKDCRTDKYEQEWNGFWRFNNLMQFAEKFIAVSSVGISHMDYLALPAVCADSDVAAMMSEVDDAWSAIKELLFDDDAKKFVELAKDADVPAPDEDNVGYEVEGDDGDVIATVEIAWPDRRVGFMTAEQTVDKEKLEQLGWKILNLFDVADIDTASYFGGDN